MAYYCQNEIPTATEALSRYNQEKNQNMARVQQQNAGAMAMNGQIPFPNARMNNMQQPTQFHSPGLQHLGLPNQQSPHMNHTPSPGHVGQGGVQMINQGSMGGSTGPSTNTSPNVNNKRRRASAIKEEDAPLVGQSEKTKPSPRVGGKRQKGGPA